MRACKKDANHNDIAAAWQQCGFVVIDTSWSGGKLLDMIPYNRSRFFFVEVKMPGKYKLTPDEKKFFSDHPEHSVVCQTYKDVLAWVTK
jgi:hypothetical protein